MRQVLFHKILLFVLTFLLALSFSTKVSAATFEEDVVSLINSERQKQNLPNFNFSDKLFQASLDHNNKMYDCSKSYGVNSCFQHQVTLLSEASLLPRIKTTGYNPQSVAENIAWGYTTPKSVVAGWMGSSGHRANILGNYKDIGCDYLNALNGSYQGMYWTCDFGKSFSTQSNPSPTPTRTSTPKLGQASLTPTPTRTPTPTLSQTTISPTSTPTPTLSPNTTPVPGSNAWWCLHAPNSIFCKP